MSRRSNPCPEASRRKLSANVPDDISRAVTTISWMARKGPSEVVSTLLTQGLGLPVAKDDTVIQAARDYRIQQQAPAKSA